MPKNPEWLAKLKAKKYHLEEWLRRHKQADEVAGEVQKNLDFTNWQIQALEGRPQESDEIPLPELSRTLDSDFVYLQSALPLMPTYDKSQVIAASAFTSSGTASVYEFASRVRDVGTPQATAYSDRVTVTFQELQARHDRPNELRRLLGQLSNAGTLQRLEATLASYQAFKRGTANRTAVAIDMRNLVDGVKGDLLEGAMKRPGEDITWEAMAARLARGGIDSPQHQELLSLKKRHTSLFSRLSDIAKDREGGSLTNIDDVWAETQDYLVALIGFVQL